MLTCGKRRKKPENFPDQRVVFRTIPGLAARPHRAAASPRPREAHRRPTARDPAAAATPPPRRTQPPTPPRVASGAGGGPALGRGGRPETDAPHGIGGRSWPAYRPLSGPSPSLAAVDRRPIRRPAWTRSIVPHRSPRRPGTPAHAASLSRPPEREWTDGRPPAAATQEGPMP